MDRPECTLFIAPEPDPIHDAPVPAWLGVAFTIVVYCLTGYFLGWIFVH